MMIRTKGPATERGRRGGGAIGGGLITGLDIVHLARGRWLRVGCTCRRWRRRWRAGGIYSGIRWQWAHVSRRRRIALEKLHHANDKQNGRPRSVELDVRNAVEEKQHAQSNEHRGPHKP